MKQYQNKYNELLFLIKKKKLHEIFKFFIKIIGIKYLIYKLLYLLLSFFFKNKSYFIKSILFDVQKKNSLLITVNNNFDEKFIIFSNDKVISKELFVKKKFDIHKLQKTIVTLNKKIQIENLYDIGANIGVICIPALKRNLVKLAYAVEPEQENFKLLKANIILNNLENKITPYNFALSEKDDEILEMELSSDNFGDHRIRKNVNYIFDKEKKRNLIQVKSKKFDTVFPKTNPLKDLVWIDTQGHEASILNGANLLIENKTPIVIEFWPYGLKRSNNWDKMISILYRFSHYIDLSETKIEIKKLNSANLNFLINDWDQELGLKHSLFKDLVLLRE